MIDEVRVKNRRGNEIKVLKPFVLMLMKRHGEEGMTKDFNLVSLK